MSRPTGTSYLKEETDRGEARAAIKEILIELNTPEDFILTVVEVDGTAGPPRYVRRPFHKEPDFGVTSVNYALRDLLARAEAPHWLAVTNSSQHWAGKKSRSTRTA